MAMPPELNQGCRPFAPNAWEHIARHLAIERLCPMADEPEKIFLSPAQLAKLIPYSVKTLERMRARGQGPPFTKPSGRVLYYRPDVFDWLKQKSGHGQ